MRYTKAYRVTKSDIGALLSRYIVEGAPSAEEALARIKDADDEGTAPKPDDQDWLGTDTDWDVEEIEIMTKGDDS